MGKQKTNNMSVDEYLASIPDDKRIALQKIRDFVKKIVPECRERVSYGVPIISLGRDLIGFSAQKDFCSFYTMSPSLTKKMKNDLEEFKVSGATIHFNADKPLPEKLIKKIVKERLEENKKLIK